MRKYFLCGLSLIIFLCAFSGEICAQGFNSITAPDGFNIIAVGNSGKIFRSSNSGDTWSSYTYSRDDFRSVCSSGDDVWIGATNGNIYKTLKTINSTITSYNIGTNHKINSIDFVNSTKGFVCCDGGYVYKTENGGVNWSPSSKNFSSNSLNAINFLDEKNGAIAGNGGFIYFTSDGGKTWDEFSGFTNKNLLDIKYFSDGIVAVGEYGIIMVKETSGSWKNVITRTESDIRGITGSSINDVHVCGGGGFIRNNKNGSENFFNFEKNPMLANLVDIFYYDENEGFAVSSLNEAIIKTVNSGLNWSLPPGASVSYNWIQKSPSGFGIGNNLCMHPKDRNSAFVVYGNKVFVSHDRSETWTQIATIGTGIKAHSFYVSPIDTNIWLAAMDNNSPDYIVRSTDYGVNWNVVISLDFTIYGQPLEMDQNNPSIFYFAPANGPGIGMYKSTDIGATFKLVAPYNNSAISEPCDMIIKWDDPNVLFIGDDGADIWKTTDNAQTWVLVKPGSAAEIPSMCNTVFDNSICYATTFGTSTVYKTLNSGDNWNIISTNSGTGWGSDMCHEDPTVVLTGNFGAQAYLSTNGGTNFFNVNTGLSGGGAGMMVPERGYFLSMQTSNLYKLNIVYSVLTTVNQNTISTLAPTEFDLSQNYPNPFNPVTNIRFALPVTGNISLKVYDRLGKEIALLSDGIKSAGLYEISFDATQFSSGVYFYRLTTDKFTETRKMTLIK